MKKALKARFMEMQSKKTAAIAGLMVVAGSAHAELPAGVTTAISGLQTDALAMQGIVWTAVIALTGGWVLMRIFRKGANKVG